MTADLPTVARDIVRLAWKARGTWRISQRQMDRLRRAVKAIEKDRWIDCDELRRAVEKDECNGE